MATAERITQEEQDRRMKDIVEDLIEARSIISSAEAQMQEAEIELQRARHKFFEANHVLGRLTVEAQVVQLGSVQAMLEASDRI